MKKIFSAALLAAFSLFALQAEAVPAKRGLRQYKQPDGTVVSVSLNGDEHFHYYLTADQLPLVEDASGALYFATIDNGNGSPDGMTDTTENCRKPTTWPAMPTAVHRP